MANKKASPSAKVKKQLANQKKKNRKIANEVKILEAAQVYVKEFDKEKGITVTLLRRKDALKKSKK